MPAADNNDLGNFDAEPSQTAAQPSALIPVGPELQNAKELFAQMQTKYSFDDVDLAGGDFNTSSEDVSLRNFLVS